MVALVTPMHHDGSLDKKSLQNLVEWHIDSKTDALVVCGTTGESATLSAQEQAELISLVIKQVNGRIPVIAGSGSNSTLITSHLTAQAKALGADACLIVTPYYNKPTQKGLIAHYETIASKVNIPIILYNVPGRTGCDLLPETVSELAKVPNIIGIKEATGKVERATEILRLCGNDFYIYSGDDATALDLMLQGAKGVISVTSNIAPFKMAELCEAALRGDIETAQKLNAELMPLHTKLFLEPNPIPAKWALYEMGMVEKGIRLPLLPLDQKFHEPLKEAMRAAHVLQFTETR